MEPIFGFQFQGEHLIRDIDRKTNKFAGVSWGTVCPTVAGRHANKQSLYNKSELCSQLW